MGNQAFQVSYEETLYDIDDAILNQEFDGFEQDYLILHSLIRKYKPKTFFEIGTNMGTGTNIICNAMSKHSKPYLSLMKPVECTVKSLDLPTELCHLSLQHPINEGKGDKVGSYCEFPYTQLRGDSMTFDFSKYPCEGYFVDGEHLMLNVSVETKGILDCTPKIIIYHDADLTEVLNGIKVWLPNKDYNLFRVTGTRIVYALSK